MRRAMLESMPKRPSSRGESLSLSPALIPQPSHAHSHTRTPTLQPPQLKVPTPLRPDPVRRLAAPVSSPSTSSHTGPIRSHRLSSHDARMQPYPSFSPSHHRQRQSQSHRTAAAAAGGIGSSSSSGASGVGIRRLPSPLPSPFAPSSGRYASDSRVRSPTPIGIRIGMGPPSTHHRSGATTMRDKYQYQPQHKPSLTHTSQRGQL